MSSKKIFSFFLSCFFYFFFFSCSSISVPEYKISMITETIQKTLPRKKILRIVQISDFHSNDFGKDEKKLINLIKNQNPDLIFFTGDIFDFYTSRVRPTENVRALLEGINEICPFFYVAGNHEFYFYHEDEFSHIFEEYGGKILRDTAVAVHTPKGTVIVAGVYDPVADLPVKERAKSNPKDNVTSYLKRLASTYSVVEKLDFEESQSDNFVEMKILLAHRPEYINAYLQYDYDLILSGHAHGGQIRAPWAKNGLYAPHQGIFPKYSGGKFDFTSKNKSQTLIVSRGLSWQKPFFPRLFNELELVCIDVEIPGRK